MFSWTPSGGGLEVQILEKTLPVTFQFFTCTIEKIMK